jgi:hypothetical protein
MNPNKSTEIQRDNRLEDLLTDLRAEHRSIQPPASLEASILHQASLEQAASPRKSTLSRYVWSLALTAAAIAIAVILLYPHRPSPPVTQTGTTTLPAPKPIPAPASLNAGAQPPEPLPRTKQRPAPRHHSSPGPFVSLPSGIGLPEPTQAMLIRTRIDTSSLRSYGLTPPPPGAPQTILADFLVGEDGLPRAIRLVP